MPAANAPDIFVYVTALQLSVADGERVCAAARPLASLHSSVLFRLPAAVVHVGAVLSVTVKATMQLVLLPAASVTVTVMLVTPVPTSVPAAGLCVFTKEPAAVQLSVAGVRPVTSGTCARQLLLANADCAGAHDVITGAVWSVTVKVVVQFVLLPEASVTVIVIIVTPEPTKVPAAGLCVFVNALPQSVAVTRPVTLGTAAWQLPLAFAVCAGAHAVITGAVISLFVTLNVQVCVLPAASVAVSVITVMPVALTVVPAAGDCVITIRLEGVQLSVAVARPV